MSKRHRPTSPSDPSAKTTRLPQTTKPFVCELPPTCNKHPTTLESTAELESHYSTCHAHVCSAEGCNRIFPEPRFLDLHQTECHDPIASIRKDRGERIFVCFDVNCKSTFMSPKGRRLHLIDKHKYPPNFYFPITNKGIGGLLRKWGEGATLLRKEYTPTKRDAGSTHEKNEGLASPVDEDSENDDLVLPKSEFASGHHTPRTFTASSPATTAKIQTLPEAFEAEVHQVHHMDASPLELAPSVDVDTLVDSMSSLALVPPSVHFGRGGVRGGFKPMRGMVLRGRGRARGRGRGG